MSAASPCITMTWLCPRARPRANAAMPSAVAIERKPVRFSSSTLLVSSTFMPPSSQCGQAIASVRPVRWPAATNWLR